MSGLTFAEKVTAAMLDPKAVRRPSGCSKCGPVEYTAQELAVANARHAGLTASAPLLLCVLFPGYRERHWTFFMEPFARAGWRVEFALVDERGPLAAAVEKASAVGMPDAVMQWDEHGHARTIQTWRDVVAWAYAHDVAPLMLDFGYVSHYEQFMFDVYQPDGSSMIDLDWPTISSDPIDWTAAGHIPTERRRRVLRGYADARTKPRLIEEPYVCLWLQQYGSLCRLGERHNNDIVAAAAVHAKRLGLRLAVKTAPATPAVTALTTWPDDVLVFKHEECAGDINQRLAVHAEYCMVVSSSITNEFVLNDLPVVALGRSWFSGKGIFYEPATWADLPAKAPTIDAGARNRWLRWWLSHQFASAHAGPALKRIMRHARQYARALTPRPGSSVTCVYAPDAQTEAIARKSLTCTRAALPGWKTIVGVDAASPAFMATMFGDRITMAVDSDGEAPRMGKLLAAAVARAEGRYVFTVEHDSFLDRNQAERAVRLMDALPARVAGLYLQSVTPEGKPTYPWTNDWPKAAPWDTGGRLRLPQWSALSCTLWRRSALRQVNWSRVPALEFVDGEICRQLAALGYHTLMTDRAHAVHLPHTGRKCLAGSARTLAIGCERNIWGRRGIRFGWNGEKSLSVRGHVPGALPFDDNSFREIYVGRELTELTVDQSSAFVNEAFRVLRHGGRLDISGVTPYIRDEITGSRFHVTRDAGKRIAAIAQKKGPADVDARAGEGLGEEGSGAVVGGLFASPQHNRNAEGPCERDGHGHRPGPRRCNHADSKTRRSARQPRLKLNLGCGKAHRDGYVNVDNLAACDVKDDIRTLTKVDSGTADEIFADHCLEHVGRFDVARTLRTWRRVLKPGGTAEIGVPDSSGVARLLLEACDRSDLRGIDHNIKCTYGNQVDPGQFHRWGFTPETLRFHLEQAGFVDVHVRTCVSHTAPSLVATAVAPGAAHA